MKYVIAESPERIFVNPSIGCVAKCAYCYLPHINSAPSSVHIEYSSEQIIELVISSEAYISGKLGTIISIGCYTESWYESNKQITKELIKFFVKKGNPIQLATKRHIEETELYDVVSLTSWDSQVGIFTSNSTISNWREFEQDTIAPYERFNNFLLSKLKGIGSYLYIKPVLKGITIQDIGLYTDVIQKYSISDVVVGSMFVPEFSSIDVKAPIGDGALAYEIVPEEDVIIDELSRYCKVHKNSTDIIKRILKENR